MPIELKVPAMGESITEVEIGSWLKPEGASVAKDENVVTLESDKATVELPSPAAGKITRILKKKGQQAAVGEVIAYLEQGNAPADSPAPAKESAPSPAKKNSEPAANKTAPAPAPTKKAKTAPAPVPEPEVAAEPAKSVPAPAEPVAVETNEAAESVSTTTPPNAREEEIVPMSPLRRAVARHLVEAQHTAALLTTINEIDMSAVMGLRKEYQAAFQEKYGIKLGIMSFFVKASVEALKTFPQVNAEVRETNIVYRNYYDIGVAIGGGKGLVVPVLRNAERLSFAEIETAISGLGQRAKENKLKPEELQGGTFTITNGGVYGSLLSTPIVNAPQSGILGLHTIQDRPVARDGNVVIRPMMYVALTYDHRVVDGREAVGFLKRVKDAVENPTRMLLEV
jgi:2-oxoglutarate dehydrogenase E2 component (dihydrolipoamide succinyltransferase)